MEASRLAALAFKHADNTAAEEIYLRTGHDYTKPVTFYAFINEHCNVKCRYCEFWRLKHYVKEMTIDEWKNALASVKDFVGDFSINFSGGEPFIKPGFIDLLAWCNKKGISAGVTTNGSALTRKPLGHLVAIGRSLAHHRQQAQVEHAPEQLGSATTGHYHARHSSWFYLVTQVTICVRWR